MLSKQNEDEQTIYEYNHTFKNGVQSYALGVLSIKLQNSSTANKATEQITQN